MPKSVLASGLDPAFVDFTQFPDLTPDRIRAFIDSHLDRLRGLGYEADSCLVDLVKPPKPSPKGISVCGASIDFGARSSGVELFVAPVQEYSPRTLSCRALLQSVGTPPIEEE
jgi:hypothetical protein